MNRLANAVVSGKVKLYKERANGTLRRIEWIDGERKAIAEYALARVADGVPFTTVAVKELKVSPSTLRRLVNALELREAIESGEYNHLYEAGLEALTF